MKLLLACVIMAAAMNAQNFNGVTVGGDVGRPTIINQSDKSLMGYAFERHTSNGIVSARGSLDLDWLAKGKPIQPGEERPFGLSTVFRVGGEAEPVSYELTAVLFADGTFFGPDAVFQDFSGRIFTVRSLARDAQYSTDKYTVLAQHQAALGDLKAATRMPVGDFRALELRSRMAGILLAIRDAGGDQESEAAIARLAGLPDVIKGETK